MSSGELRRHEDKEAFYRLRAQANTEKYLSLLSARVMSTDMTTPRAVPKSRTVIEGPPKSDETLDRGYNRFAHVLQFDGSTGIRKAEVVNGQRNEALQRIRERIRQKRSSVAETEERRAWT